MKNPDVLNRKDLSNLAKLSIEAGGSISKLKIPSSESLGDGLTNGSVLLHEGKWLLNLRRVGYLLYQSENKQTFPSPFGPLVYYNPEDDIVLRTTNYICELDAETYEIRKWAKADTSKLDVPPMWDFVGLEDARLQFWDNKLYQTGVRRDTTTNGEGRMELSTVEMKSPSSCKETERVRIAPPDPRTHAQGGSYCEKNWMPINDMPYHYVKWTNPTEVVKVNPKTKSSEVVKNVENPNIKTKRDMRGSSNVIKYKDYWVAIIHEVDLWFNKDEQKDSIYYHRFVVWDKDWNIKYISDEFDFMTARVEFTCGIALDGDNFIIPFGFQDHTSFMLKMPTSLFEYITKMSKEKPSTTEIDEVNNLYKFIKNPFDANVAFSLAEEYYNEGHWSSSLGFFLRAAEFTDDLDLKYNSCYMIARSMANKSGRDTCERLLWEEVITIDPTRPEGYGALAGYHSWRGNMHDAYFISKVGYNLSAQCKTISEKSDSYAITDKESLDMYTKLFGNSFGKIDEKIQLLTKFKKSPNDYPQGLHAYMNREADRYGIN